MRVISLALISLAAASRLHHSRVTEHTKAEDTAAAVKVYELAVAMAKTRKIVQIAQEHELFDASEPGPECGMLVRGMQTVSADFCRMGEQAGYDMLATMIKNGVERGLANSTVKVTPMTAAGTPLAEACTAENVEKACTETDEIECSEALDDFVALVQANTKSEEIKKLMKEKNIPTDVSKQMLCQMVPMLEVAPKADVTKGFEMFNAIAASACDEAKVKAWCGAGQALLQDEQISNEAKVEVNETYAGCHVHDWKEAGAGQISVYRYNCYGWACVDQGGECMWCVQDINACARRHGYWRCEKTRNENRKHGIYC